MTDVVADLSAQVTATLSALNDLLAKHQADVAALAATPVTPDNTAALEAQIAALKDGTDKVVAAVASVATASAAATASTAAPAASAGATAAPAAPAAASAPADSSAPPAAAAPAAAAPDASAAPAAPAPAPGTTA